MSTYNRHDERIKHRTKIRVILHPEHTIILNSRDYSDTGLYLETADTEIVTLDSEIQVQTLAIDDAPVLQVRIVRIDKGQGFAACFMLD